MIKRLVLVCVVASFGVIGSACGSSGDGGDGAGGEAGSGGAGGATGGAGGAAGSGGAGGAGGQGGAGGEEPTFTSSRERSEAGLTYQLERCQCQSRGAPISESACLPTLATVSLPPSGTPEAAVLPLSDRQDECFDEVILGEELMTIENRFACLIDVDLAAADCLADVTECSESAIDECVAARTTGLGDCPTPQEDVIPMVSPCLATVVEDGVDAFLDSRSARCGCLADCTPADPEPGVVECMEDVLQSEVDMLGPMGSTALRCITTFWREQAVCFDNELSCEGPETACSDIPPRVCDIEGTVLDVCLVL